MPAMDDFMPHIDRRTIFLERKIDDVDCPVDSGAKTSRIGEIDLHSCHLSLTEYRRTLVRHILTDHCCHLTSEQRAPSTQLARASFPFSTNMFREPRATSDNSASPLDRVILPP